LAVGLLHCGMSHLHVKSVKVSEKCLTICLTSNTADRCYSGLKDYGGLITAYNVHGHLWWQLGNPTITGPIRTKTSDILQCHMCANLIKAKQCTSTMSSLSTTHCGTLTFIHVCTHQRQNNYNLCKCKYLFLLM